MRQISLDRHKKFKSTSEIHVSQICSIHLKTSLCGTELPWEEFLTRSGFALCWKIVLTNSSTVLVRSMMFPIEILEECFKKSRIQESPTDRPMRIVGPIQFWKGCVIYPHQKVETTDPHHKTDSVHVKMLTRFSPLEHIPVFRALLEIEIKNADSVHSAGTHPRF